MSSEWGRGYIRHGCRWEGLISWLNWIIRHELHSECPNEACPKDSVLFEVDGSEHTNGAITINNVLTHLSDPYFLQHLLRLHPAFVPLSDEMFASLQSPPQRHDQSSYHSHQLKQIRSNQMDLRTGLMLTTSHRFLNMRARTLFLLNNALSFIQSEIPYSRVRPQSFRITSFSDRVCLPLRISTQNAKNP